MGYGWTDGASRNAVHEGSFGTPKKYSDGGKARMGYADGGKAKKGYKKGNKKQSSVVSAAAEPMKGRQAQIDKALKDAGA